MIAEMWQQGMKNRTEAIAKHLTKFLQDSDPFGKTIVFCVDQEHAENMRAAIARNNSDLMRQYPDYVCRVVSDEGDIGRGHLDPNLERWRLERQSKLGVGQ